MLTVSATRRSEKWNRLVMRLDLLFVSAILHVNSQDKMCHLLRVFWFLANKTWYHTPHWLVFDHTVETPLQIGSLVTRDSHVCGNPAENVRVTSCVLRGWHTGDHISCCPRFPWGSSQATSTPAHVLEKTGVCIPMMEAVGVEAPHGWTCRSLVDLRHFKTLSTDFLGSN